jgi:hypothetical protein
MGATIDQRNQLYDKLFLQDPVAMHKAFLAQLHAVVPMEDIWSDTTATHIKWQRFYATTFRWACEDTLIHRISGPKDDNMAYHAAFRSYTERDQVLKLNLGGRDDIPVKWMGVADRGLRKGVILHDRDEKKYKAFGDSPSLSSDLLIPRAAAPAPPTTTPTPPTPAPTLQTIALTPQKAGPTLPLATAVALTWMTTTPVLQTVVPVLPTTRAVMRPVRATLVRPPLTILPPIVRPTLSLAAIAAPRPPRTTTMVLRAALPQAMIPPLMAVMTMTVMGMKGTASHVGELGAAGDGDVFAVASFQGKLPSSTGRVVGVLLIFIRGGTALFSLRNSVVTLPLNLGPYMSSNSYQEICHDSGKPLICLTTTEASCHPINH